MLLVASVVYAQQTAPAPPPAPPEPLTQAFSLFVNGGGFLGVHAEDIDKEKAARYNLREARGVGITNVVAGSPAEKAGLRKDDVILRLDNDNVTSVRKLNRLVSEIAPDHTVRLLISRGGAEQEVSVTIGERKNFANTLQGMRVTPRARARVWAPDDLKGNIFEGESGSFVFAFGGHRRIGVSTTQLTKQLAEYFGIADGQGVLVTAVTEDGPAAKAGIKAGDVITAVDGEKVGGAGELARAINKKKEGDISLTIVRDRNQRTITVTPKESEPRVLSPGQMSRRVVLPRIELPTIPAVNINLPRIELPVIPEITVDVGDTVRRVGGVRQPI
jgi:serine protease Do